VLSKLINLWGYFDRPHQMKVILILFVTAAGAFLEMAGLGLTLPVLNFLISGDLPNVLSKFFLNYGITSKEQISSLMISFFAGFYLIKNILLAFFTYHLYRCLADIKVFVSSRLFKGYIQSDYIFFIANNSSELTKNLTTLVNNFNIFVLIPIGILLTELLVLATLIILSIIIKPIESTILFLVIFIPSFIFIKLTKLKLRNYGKQSLANEAMRIKTANEMVGAIRDIQLFDKEGYFIKLYNTYDRLTAVADFRNTFISQSSKYFLESTLIFAFAALIFSLSNTTNSLIDILPTLGFYALVGFRSIPSVNRMINQIQAIKFGEAIIDTICDEFLRHSPSASKKRRILYSFKRNISITNLKFRYKFDQPYIFQDISLTIKKGESLGIVGETGSGKSTFMNILLGILIPSKGKITIDGNDIHKNKPVLTHILGFVPQDIFLLDDSIAKNVAFGEEDSALDLNKVNWALKEALLENFIKKHDSGIYTKVGERGIRLSGGQKQRLGIARALYYGAQILVFDEATSSMDEETERLVMKNIDKMKKKYTLIIVAHRLSTLRGCDRVLKLDSNGLKKTTLT
jgi:ABC-type multidrug transport system fused ATPase/permease subunit